MPKHSNSDLDAKYQKALKSIDDLEPFIELVDKLKNLAGEGRVNDMRRELVIFCVNNFRKVEEIKKATKPEKCNLPQTEENISTFRTVSFRNATKAEVRKALKIQEEE